eukprot:COSAG02_NODE_163_length_32424_cov_21.759010_9_plen_118_part_00
MNTCCQTGQCTDPDTGELLPDFGFCERDPDTGELLDPGCREQPNPVWPGGGQYNGDDGTRGIEPMVNLTSLLGLTKLLVETLVETLSWSDAIPNREPDVLTRIHFAGTGFYEQHDGM